MAAESTVRGRFGPDVTWGVATSSYQIEGAENVDGRGPSIWDTFSRQPGAVVGGDTGEVAIDHYHRLDEDLDLLAWLGVDAYRFSIAWPRILPDGRTGPHGRGINRAGLDFYKRLVHGLRDRGIEPYPTLYHWDLPQALQDEGGWAVRSTAEAFAEYAGVVAAALPDVVHWATLNEPWCSAFLGYRAGVHAPGHRDQTEAVSACHHLNLAHSLAIPVLREELDSGAQLGVVLNLAEVTAASDSPVDRDAKRRVDGGRNRAWLDPMIRGYYAEDLLRDWSAVADLSAIRRRDPDLLAPEIDWLGLNYYHPITVKASGRPEDTMPEPATEGLVLADPPGPRTAMGWPIDASGLTETLVRIERDYGPIPIVITENGAAFDDEVGPDGTIDDQDRIAYVDAHLGAAAEAVEQGVDLRGYFLWSMFDNFEWAEGYAKRFGIIWVDYDTLERTPKASAHWYRDQLAASPPA